eukprot:COSAG02_NODE_37941_length_435_cov_1.074405_1_plen_74_part_10
MQLCLRFLLLVGLLATFASSGKRERAKRRSSKRRSGGGGPGTARTPPSEIADCQFGLDFLTVDELFQRPEPCLV